MRKRKLYSISEATELSGLSIKRVRRYADANLLPEVERVIHGDRVYRHFTKLDLSMLKLIRKYRDQGYYLKPAVKLTKKDLGLSENKGVRC
jgi:DNA-binding transcriptional MerR regulator